MKKQDVLELLDQFPDEVDAERLMESLYLRAKLEQAETAIREGDVISQKEVERRSREWLK